MEKAEFEQRPKPWRDQYIRHFEEKYVEQLNKICALGEIRARLQTKELARLDLLLKLDEIASLRHRYDPAEFQRLQILRKRADHPRSSGAPTMSVEPANETYQMVIQQGVEAASQANKETEILQHALCTMDLDHIERFTFWVERIQQRFGLDPFGDDWIETLKTLRRISVMLQIYSISLSLTVDNSREKRRQGKSGRPLLLAYLEPTKRLMDLWLELTGTRVVTPKWTKQQKGHEQVSEQQSTEFVRLGLKMIIPSITFAQVKTSLEHVLSFEKNLAELFGEIESKEESEKLSLLRHDIGQMEDLLSILSPEW